MLEALPAVTVPFLSKAGLSFASVSSVGVAARSFVGVEDGDARLGLDLDRQDLLFEVAVVDGVHGPAVALGGQRVLVLAR